MLINLTRNQILIEIPSGVLDAHVFLNFFNVVIFLVLVVFVLFHVSNTDCAIGFVTVGITLIK